MRELICVIPLLCGCSTPAVRCDAHLQPINPPQAAGTQAVPTVRAAATGVPSAAAQPAEAPAAASRGTP